MVKGRGSAAPGARGAGPLTPGGGGLKYILMLFRMKGVVEILWIFGENILVLLFPSLFSEFGGRGLGKYYGYICQDIRGEYFRRVFSGFCQKGFGKILWDDG
jgi:hypothetical protein